MAMPKGAMPKGRPAVIKDSGPVAEAGVFMPPAHAFRVLD